MTPQFTRCCFCFITRYCGPFPVVSSCLDQIGKNSIRLSGVSLVDTIPKTRPCRRICASSGVCMLAVGSLSLLTYGADDSTIYPPPIALRLRQRAMPPNYNVTIPITRSTIRSYCGGVALLLARCHAQFYLGALQQADRDCLEGSTHRRQPALALCPYCPPL